ncbi:hypothetical protein QWY75_07425 [Pontixanthobacter aestiaquae]|uniref:Uncharacterized protein n=1 Tax=Pontixanthobacter aestiaquae TaxID=1509367 RepID=A0A844Z4X6_9SPHN|nr:hypothetical protein [Pontixanthobacter aestiaquae]MDN3646033.1 hypothetical protein [Pontixanthobacter aestiaquae]MXO82975.1 hypothetical protein [Pontixanthobacter aestiaquae]
MTKTVKRPGAETKRWKKPEVVAITPVRQTRGASIILTRGVEMAFYSPS